MIESTHNADTARTDWWIGHDLGDKWLGPFGSEDLAFRVRSYVETATKPTTYWVFEAARIDGEVCE